MPRPAARVLLQSSPGDLERISNHQIDVFAGGRHLKPLRLFRHLQFLDRSVQRRHVIDYDLGSRDGQVDTYVKTVPSLTMLMWYLDHHTTTHNSRIKVLELRRLRADPRFDPGRRLHISPRDLYRYLH